MPGSFPPLPQIQPFQAPDLVGMSNAMQTQSLNAMREQQLMGAEKENMDLRRLMSDPNFDPTTPGAMNRILSVAPRSGAQTYQALMAAQRERRQADVAATEQAAKYTQLFRDMLPAANAENYATIRAAAIGAVPQWAPLWPETYSADAVRGLMEKADDSLKQYATTVTAAANGTGFMVSPQVQPRGAPPITGPTFYPAENIPAAVPPAPAPAAAPRAEAPGLGDPGRDMAAAMLRRSEGFRAEPYFDRTALRTGYGSDTVTQADGRVVPVTQATRVTPEDAERDLARRIPEFERKAAAAVGEERFAALPPNVRASLISVAYNYGTLPARIRNAVQSGDADAIAAAVEGLAGDNEGVNARRRREEAAVIRGANAMVPGAAPVNAMLAPPDATAAPPRTMAEAQQFRNEADLFKFMRQEQIRRDVARGEQPARVQEAGQTAEATARGQAIVRSEGQAGRVEEAGQTAQAQARGRATIAQEEEDRKRTRGQEQLEGVLQDMLRQYTRLNELGGIPSERRPALSNIPAFVSGTQIGQMGGRAVATPSQTARNQIESLRNQLLQAFKGATGMTGREADSNQDVARLLAAMSDTTMSIEAVRGIIASFSRRYGSGKLSDLDAPAEPAPPAAAPTAPRDGVPGRRGAAPAQGQYQEGQTATGPNGQRVIFRGGQWVPAQ